MIIFLHGALTMASLGIGVFFLRYWRVVGDRLFVLFSAAFWMLGLHWALVALLPRLGTQAHLLRFAAFGLIGVAVWDKNHERRSERR